jgi:hypothetical protein
MLMMLPMTNMKLVDTNNTLMGQNVELVLETQFFNMRGLIWQPLLRAFSLKNLCSAQRPSFIFVAEPMIASY